ncbi:MAG: hypothetical protein ACRENG_09980 [bacterium]
MLTRYANWLRLALVLLFAIMSAVACAQEREEGDEDETAQTEKKDAEAAKRARKGERKSRKEKKSGKAELPPAPATPVEFEFFDGAIFSRKVNLGLKNVLCFASERRPLAMLWQEGSATTVNSTVKLSARELQLVFGRAVDAAQVSVLNAGGQMLSRGTAAQVAFNLGRKPVYLLVEAKPSRLKASEIAVEEIPTTFSEDLAEVRVYPDPKRAQGSRTIVFANLTQQVTIQILDGEKVVFETANPGAPVWKWDGFGQNRQPLPDGRYQYRILSKGGSASGVLDLAVTF